MKNTRTKRLVMIALAIAINIAGSKLALFMSLPIYMDSIGTVLASILLGPVAGGTVGFLAGVISGIMGDIYALYFAPSGIIMGVLAGLLLHNKKRTFVSNIWKTFVFVLPGAAVTAITETILFGGVTSAVWTTVAIGALSHTFFSLFLSSFIMQVITDYIDKFVAVTLVSIAYKYIPDDLKQF